MDIKEHPAFRAILEHLNTAARRSPAEDAEELAVEWLESGAIDVSPEAPFCFEQDLLEDFTFAGVYDPSKAATLRGAGIEPRYLSILHRGRCLGEQFAEGSLSLFEVLEVLEERTTFWLGLCAERRQ